MIAPMEAAGRSRTLGATDRAVAAFLLALMGVGCLAMWIAVPAAWLWFAGQIASDQTQHILLAVFGVPIAIIAWARGLFWVNRLYMRVTMPRLMQELEEEAEDDDEHEPRRLRGPLEPFLVGALLIALIAMAVWFFGFAENPQLTA